MQYHSRNFTYTYFFFKNAFDLIRVWNLRRMNSYTYEMFLETFEIFDVWIYTRMKCSVKLFIRVTKVKPGLYFSRRLSAAVAYSFVARAGDHGPWRASSPVVVQMRSSSQKVHSRPTERQNEPSTEFKFKCKFEFEFKFLYWVVFTPRNNITCAFWMATHIVSV